MEQPVVSGIMCDKNQAKITLKEVPDQPGIAANIFEPLATASISVDMIIQNVSEQGHTDLSFTIALEELDEASLIKILTEPKNALVKQYQRLFEMEECTLEFREDALLSIAKKATERKIKIQTSSPFKEGEYFDWIDL